MYKNYSAIIGFVLIFLTSIGVVYAEDDSKKSGFELYESRVTGICDEYKPSKSIINSSAKYINYNTESILNTFGDDLNQAKSTYKTHMNDMYKCALIGSQKKGYQLVIDDLVKYTPELANKVEPKIKNTLTRLEITQKNLLCTSDNSNNDQLQKQRVLKQASYELCKYHSYLEYLKTRNDTISNLIENDNTLSGSSIALAEISQLSTSKQTLIQNEIDRAYKIFPIAFQAYSEFENNFTIHVLLELVKDDFYTYRENLHKVINPINQVVYKISNAMKLK